MRKIARLPLRSGIVRIGAVQGILSALSSFSPNTTPQVSTPITAQLLKFEFRILGQHVANDI